MKSMKQILMFLAMGVAVFPSSSLAGGSDSGVGNGGVGIIVEDQLNLLDLVEAQEVSLEDLGVSQELQEKLSEIGQYNGGLRRAIERSLRHGLIFHFTDFRLLNTNDANSPVQFSDVQLAVQRDGFVYIDHQAWNRLSTVPRVGLQIHEALVNLHADIDRSKLRQLVRKIMTGTYGTEEEFTHYLTAIGLRYYAGNTPNCAWVRADVTRTASELVADFRSWVQYSDPSDSSCVETVNALRSSVLTDVRMQTPAYCFDPRRRTIALMRNHVLVRMYSACNRP